MSSRFVASVVNFHRLGAAPAYWFAQFLLLFSVSVRVLFVNWKPCQHNNRIVRLQLCSYQYWPPSTCLLRSALADLCGPSVFSIPPGERHRLLGLLLPPASGVWRRRYACNVLGTSEVSSFFDTMSPEANVSTFV